LDRRLICESGSSNSATTNEVAGREAPGDIDKKSQVFLGCAKTVLRKLQKISGFIRVRGLRTTFVVARCS
jgi:hypothetical protein